MRLRGAALALILAGGAALAQEGMGLAPESAPRPPARPEVWPPGSTQEVIPQLIPPEEMDAREAAPPASGEETGEGLSLIPPEEAVSPENGTAETPEAEAGSGGEPSSAPPEGTPAPEGEEAPPMREVLTETEDELAACLSALDEMGVTYKRAEPIEEPENPDCGIANPLAVTEIAPGVALEPAPTLRCEAALAAARWVADTVLPLSRKLEDRGPLVAIGQGTAYLCRPRADGELSEHAFGNAIDVSGFRFATGEPIPVQPRAGEGTIEEAFQDAVRAGACLDFTTVLGPGSDEDHAEHLHLDVKARERGFRICE